MRLVPALAILAALSAAPVAAQAPARGYAAPPPRPAPPARPAPRPAVAALPPASLAGGGLASPIRPLAGLAPTGDPAPQCRARCAQARYVCDGDEADCAQRWTQCTRGCRP